MTMVCDRCGEAFLLSNDVKYMTPFDDELDQFESNSIVKCLAGDERIATAMADNGETPICPICGKKTVCTLYEFCTPENPNIIEDVKWR